MSGKLKSDEQEIIRLYLNEFIPQQVIAKQFNCSDTTIQRILLKNKITLRKHTKTKNKLWNRKGLDEKEIISLYTYKKISLGKIAKRFNCSDTLISKIIKENNIKINKRDDYKEYLYLDKEYIKHLYTIEDKCLKDIAKELGCCSETIKKRLIESNVKIKPKGYYIIGKFIGIKSPLYGKISHLRGKLAPHISESNKRRNGEKRPLSFSVFMKKWHKTHTHPMRGRTKEKNPFYNQHHSNKTKQIIGEKNKINTTNSWKNKEYREKTIKAQLKGVFRRPTSYEKRLNQIIIKHDLPYKYTGDGSFLIGYKNPDFININGQKICIEIYNPYFKIRDFGSCENYEKQRSEHFSKYGWETIFIKIDNKKFYEDEILHKIIPITRQ